MATHTRRWSEVCVALGRIDDVDDVFGALWMHGAIRVDNLAGRRLLCQCVMTHAKIQCNRHIECGLRMYMIITPAL